MPSLIKFEGEDKAVTIEDPFVFVPDEEPVPATGDVVVTLARLSSEGDALLSSGRRVGVRLQSSEAVEDLAYDLARLSVVQIVMPKFRDGRVYSSARVLRERLDYQGEVRAVGEVLREQAQHMARCGFNAFEPADSSSADEWLAATHRYRHVYQRAADDRQPLYAERAQIAGGLGHNQPGEAGA
jgi:uncharacterized protein (DUF934 family)